MDRAHDRRLTLPRSLYEPSLAHVTLLIACGVGLFLGAGLTAAWVTTLELSLWLRLPALVPLLCVSAHGVQLLEWIGHEGIHLLLHRNRYLSVVIGSFFAAMTGFSAVGYGVAHWNHHRFTNQASDPDAQIYSRFRTFWSRLSYARAAVGRAHLANMLRLALGKPLDLGYAMPFTRGWQRGFAWMNLAFLALWLATYVILGVSHGPLVLCAIVVPVVLGMQLSSLRAYVEHAGTGLGAFRDTRSYVARPYAWLLFGNNYHLEHHLYPGIPCYRLAEVHRLLEASGCFARFDSPIEAGLRAPFAHMTSVSQYSSPAFGDLSDDPFHPTLEPHASAA